MKLFPPLINNIIPAFYINENGMVEITIPFSMNRAVSKTQILGLAIKIKTVQSSSYLHSIEVTDNLYYELEDSPWVRFTITASDNKMRVGQFYKFQIAYIDTAGEVGYFSTVSTGKFTHKPEIYIDDMTIGVINTNNYEYIGIYKNQDSSERVYSYQFKLFNEVDELVEDSTEIIHNYSNDTELKESHDLYLLQTDLIHDQIYRIQYIINTINGLTLATPRYRVMSKQSIDPEIKANLVVNADYENGYIDISLVGHKYEDDLEELATGAFLLSRSSSDTNYSVWDEISRFKLAAQVPSRWIGRDYTTEQGKTYLYSLQQYNDKGLYSNRLLSNKIYSDFEDAFLFDGTRQLKIKYNPKMTTLKVDVQEAKVDTIGSKHPFIFRNGRVYYREFPISGLISYYMDEANQFIDNIDYQFEEKTTNLTSSNITQERLFKMKVLEWLSDGQPKLFRSPTEGNFIVRLMNTSLTPIDTVGRMLHTFNTTAYEIADYTYQNLANYKLIDIADPEQAQLRWETVPFFKTENGKVTYLSGKVNLHPAYTVRLVDMMPGDRVWIKFRGQEAIPIQIGATGSYYVDNGMEIESISLPEGTNSTGSMTYSYYSIAINAFNKINDVDVFEVPIQQFIGEQDIIQQIEQVYNNKTKAWVKNPKIDIIQFYNIAVERRNVVNIINYGGLYYTDREHTRLIEQFDPFTLYAVGEWKNINNLWPNMAQWEFVVLEYKDFYNNKTYSPNQYEPYIWINGEQVSVEDTRVFDMKRAGKIENVKIGNGVTAEVSYQQRVIDFNIENDENWGVLPKKTAYQNSIQTLNNYLDSDNVDPEREKTLRYNINLTYRNYIIALIEEQEKEKIAEGLL